ncbi:MAG: class I SAM-dependent methyltransferase [Bacteroidia bacterium]
MPQWLFRAKAFAKYFVKSRKGTLAHSPFVFDLARFCIYENSKGKLGNINAYRKSLLNDHSLFQKEDFGTGKSRQEKVSALARSSSIRKKYGALLNRLVAYLKPKNILELGTCLGVSTAYLAQNANKLTTVEGCPNTQKSATKHFKTAFNHHVNFINIDFDRFIKNDNGTYDFIFIDGNHAYAPTLAYFNHLWQQLPENGLIILDDIHWSEAMEKAWNEITQNTPNLISIDLFQIGLCFKKPNQAKEHFIIRV